MTIPSQIKEERGAVVVEFAIIATLLVMLVFGIIEFGRTFSEYQVFLNAARAGARKGAVRALQEDIRDAVVEAAVGYPIDRSAIEIAVKEAETLDPPCNDETVGKDLQVKWTQEFEIDIPFLPLSASRDIQGVFRCE